MGTTTLAAGLGTSQIGALRPINSPENLEIIQDAIAAMFAGGTQTNVTIFYDDTTGTLSFTASGGGGGDGGGAGGDLFGPAASSDGELMLYSGTTGKNAGRASALSGFIQLTAGVVSALTAGQFKTALSLVKGDVGLGSVDNTSDANKPVSTATQTALDAKATVVPYEPGTVSGGAQNYAIPGTTVGGVANAQALGANVIWYIPFTVEFPIAVDRLACNVTTLFAGSNIRMGIYAASRAWQPSGAALIDTGSISSATTGAKVATVSATLQPGRYLTALVCDSGTVAVRLGTVSSRVPTEISAAAFGSTANVLVGGRRASFTYAALPTSGPAWTTETDGSGSSGEPIVVMRWSYV